MRLKGFDMYGEGLVLGLYRRRKIEKFVTIKGCVEQTHEQHQCANEEEREEHLKGIITSKPKKLIFPLILI